MPRHSPSSLQGAPDPVSDVVALLRPTAKGGCLNAAGTWAVRFDPYPHVRFGNVVSGECWLTIEGREPVLLREGDWFLLGNPPRYTLASALNVRPRSAKALLAASPDGSLRVGPERAADTFVCGGQLMFDDPNAPLLLDILPVLVHVRAGDPRGALFAKLSWLLVAEVGEPSVGGALVIDRLAQVLLVHMLRAQAEQPKCAIGWLGALRDDRIGATLRAMHADMARSWTLEQLARIAKMSRSAFAAAFKAQVGAAPLAYLIQWRMAVARDALRHGTQSISELAFATGYESESAFSTAFRRVVGSSPRQFRDAARARRT